MSKALLATLACLPLAVLAGQPSPRELAVASAAAGDVVEGAARLERLVSGLQHPWSLAFTPDGEILVTEKYRGLRVVQDGKLLPGRSRAVRPASSPRRTVACSTSRSTRTLRATGSCSCLLRRATRKPTARLSGARVTKAAASWTGA